MKINLIFLLVLIVLSYLAILYVYNHKNSSTLDGDLIPSQNSVFSLGSSQFRWKDIFLSAGTLNLIDTKTNIPCKAEVTNGIFIITAEGAIPSLPVAIPAINYLYNSPIIVIPKIEGSGSEAFPINILWSNKILISTINNVSMIDMNKYCYFTWSVGNGQGFMQDGSGYIQLDVSITTPNNVSTNYTLYQYNFINGDWTPSNLPSSTYQRIILPDNLNYTGYDCVWTATLSWAGNSFGPPQANVSVIATLGTSPIIVQTIST